MNKRRCLDHRTSTTRSWRRGWVLRTDWVRQLSFLPRRGPSKAQLFAGSCWVMCPWFQVDALGPKRCPCHILGYILYIYIIYIYIIDCMIYNWLDINLYIIRYNKIIIDYTHIPTKTSQWYTNFDASMSCSAILARSWIDWRNGNATGHATPMAWPQAT